MAEKYCQYRAEDVFPKAAEDGLAARDPKNISGLRGKVGIAVRELIHTKSVMANKTVGDTPSCMFSNGICIAPNSPQADCSIAQGIESLRKL